MSAAAIAAIIAAQNAQTDHYDAWHADYGNPWIWEGPLSRLEEERIRTEESES